MISKLSHFVLLAGSALLLARGASGQDVLFDFENTNVHSPLPISLTVGGITANFTATGQGFSVQPAGTMGFTPAGFSGNCIYPSSVYAADLLVAFSRNLNGFAILYAPEEYACDSSARMRVTAYLDNTLVGTSTTNANAGTWPSEILSFKTAQAFNRVVVHYDAPPPTGGDWGPVFMADNMVVTPAPEPPSRPVFTSVVPAGTDLVLSGTNGVPGGTYYVLTSADLGLPPSSWGRLATNTFDATGCFSFVHASALSSPRQFYLLQVP